MASVTITFSAAHATRIQDALEETLQLGRPATVDDLKTYIKNDIRNFVHNSERRVAAFAAESAIDLVDIT